MKSIYLRVLSQNLQSKFIITDEEFKRLIDFQTEQDHSIAREATKGTKEIYLITNAVAYNIMKKTGVKFHDIIKVFNALGDVIYDIVENTPVPVNKDGKEKIVECKFNNMLRFLKRKW